MLSKTDFSKGIKEVCLLIGNTNPPAEQIQIFYDKLKEFDLQDFKMACADENMLNELSVRGRLIYPIVRQCIEFHRNRRINAEAEKLKKMEKDFDKIPNAEIKKLIRGLIKKW